MRRKIEILTGIVLLCSLSGFVYYELSKPACIQNPQIQILYYTMPSDDESMEQDDISDTFRDEAIQK